MNKNRFKSILLVIVCIVLCILLFIWIVSSISLLTKTCKQYLVDNDKVLVIQDNGRGIIYSINKETGNIIQELKLEEVN